MIPLDPILSVLQKLILLGVTLVLWRLRARLPLRALLPQVDLARTLRQTRARLPFVVLLLSGIASSVAWADATLEVGALQTLVMALGGPSLNEIKACWAQNEQRRSLGSAPECPRGGSISVEGERWYCSKHGVIHKLP